MNLLLKLRQRAHRHGASLHSESSPCQGGMDETSYALTEQCQHDIAQRHTLSVKSGGADGPWYAVCSTYSHGPACTLWGEGLSPQGGWNRLDPFSVLRLSIGDTYLLIARMNRLLAGVLHRFLGLVARAAGNVRPLLDTFHVDIVGGPRSHSCNGCLDLLFGGQRDLLRES